MLFLLMLVTAAAMSENAKPPVAKKVPKPDVVHGDRRVDDYFWLREKSNPEVVTIQDCGHFIPAEAPETFREAVMSFFAAHPLGAT